VVSVQAGLVAELDDLLAEDVVAARDREATTFDAVAGDRAGNIVLFGAGELGRRTLAALRADGVEPLAFADDDSSRWGTVIDGLRVMSPVEAAARFGDCAVFVVTIASASGPHPLEDSVQHLRHIGCETVVPAAWLAWRHPARLLPHDGMHLPSRLVAQKEGVRRAYNLLSDDESRAAFVAQVRWRLTGDAGCLQSPVDGTPHIATDTAVPVAGEVVLDAGADDGDTLALWLTQRGPTFSRYIALEPDPRHRVALEGYVNTLADDIADRVTVLPYAAAAQSASTTCNAAGTSVPSPGTGGDGLRVECVRIDDVVRKLGGRAPTFVMMRVEGAELDALAGAADLLRTHAPVLLLPAYHRHDHLWRLVLTIAAIQPMYEFFLRPDNAQGCGLVLYAVPPGRVPASS
jgi:FkbM family methyltransferase